MCEQLQLNDVEIEFSDSHYQSLATYKSFTQFVKPILQKENAKAPTSKLMMLIAAKWREFCEENPNLQEEEPEAEKSDEDEEEEEVELEYQPKPSRSRRGAEKQEEPEESEEEDVKKKKKSAARASTSKRGRKQKVVPTLKIKFGKKKDQSSDEEKVRFHILMKFPIFKLNFIAI